MINKIIKEKSQNKVGFNKKYTYEFVFNYFNDRKCILLEKEYKSNTTKMKYICSCGRESTTRLSHFMKGYRCGCQNKFNSLKHGHSCTGKKSTEYYNYRCSIDPSYKLRYAISHRIRECIKRNLNNKDGNIFDYLPYTIDELKKHLEKQFEPWMNWNNYGGNASKKEKTWWIDHIVPQSYLTYDSLNHPNFLKCWDLNNLRPLEKIENIKKNDNYEPSWNDDV